ncbi:MAG UNVERIFIED_CONTAM: hypothetical protein LVT10_26340 [Anaerolineae bacterium]
MDAGEDLYILDVRNPEEWAISAIEGTVRLPKPDIEAAKNSVLAGRESLAETVIQQIPNDREVIVHCRSGKRSADVIEFLRVVGYTNKLVNVTGGILAWSDEIDPTQPKY